MKRRADTRVKADHYHDPQGAIDAVVEIGYRMHERAEQLIDALDGIEREVKALRRAARDLKREAPKRPSGPSETEGE